MGSTDSSDFSASTDTSTINCDAVSIVIHYPLTHCNAGSFDILETNNLLTLQCPSICSFYDANTFINLIDVYLHTG